MPANTERFSNRVDNYVKYRPHYPKEIISYLNTEINFNASFAVADIGSGTGILTELFLQNGNPVFAVEPNEAMRLKAEELFGNYKNFTSINGTAENTTIKNNSVDLIVAAQSFHWFDAIKTKEEFKRIAKPNAFAALIWNERQVESDFEKGYENFLLKYATDYSTVNHKNISEEKIGAFFYPGKFTVKAFENNQVFSFEGLKGRLLSSSYIPLENNDRFTLMINELKELFEKYQQKEEVFFNYITKVYSGKIS